jgi:hypothetical protein
VSRQVNGWDDEPTAGELAFHGCLYALLIALIVVLMVVAALAVMYEPRPA